MGVVHLATDPAGRAVALKVLRAHVANDQEARRRLGREVATLRRVRHPRVAEVLDADVAGAEPYLVTRFVPGRSLEEEVHSTGPLPAGQVARIGRALAEALSAIHAVGVVHRDLKPANVMLVDGDPVLIDFGIAHIADESRITRTGLVMGTPGYLSPELIYGGAVTSATDWWAWGATLVFAATGRQPFGTGPVEAVLERVRRGQAEVDGVEAGLKELLTATLTVDPARRPTAAQLVTRLDAVIAGVTTSPSAVDQGGPDQQAPTARTAPPDRTRRMPPPGNTRAEPARGRSPRGGRDDVARRDQGQGRKAAAAPIPPYPGARAGRNPSHPAAGHAPPPPPYGPPPAPHRTASAPPPGYQLPRYAPPQHPQHPQQAAGTSSPRRITGTLALLALALAAVAAVAPGGAVVLTFCWSVLARLAQRSSTGLQRRRRELGGPSSTDMAVVVVTLPWRFAMSVVMSLVALVVPALVAASTAFIVGSAVASGEVPRPSAAIALFIGMLAGIASAWWGPGGWSLRTGSRAIVRTVTGGSTGRSIIGAVCLIVVLAALMVGSQSGYSPDWAPFPPPSSLVGGGPGLLSGSDARS